MTTQVSIDRLSADEKRRLLKQLLARREGPRRIGGARRAYPLAFSQERLWFLHQLEGPNPAYHLSTCFETRGLLELPALRRALAEVVRRHPILRATFHLVQDRPVQRLDAVLDPLWPRVDLDRLGPARRRLEAERLVRSFSRRPFDLEAGPVLRSAFLRLGPERGFLVLVHHHIVSDGWSVGILLHELLALYNAFNHGRPSPLEELPVRFVDFAAWQRKRLTGARLAEQLAWWQEHLGQGSPRLALPLDRPRPAVQTSNGAALEILLPRPLVDGLENLAEGLRGDGAPATLFMTLLAAFFALLHRITGQQDLSVGTPVAGRSHSQVEGLIGFFVNVLVLRTRIRPDDDFRRLLGRVRRTALQCFDHQEIPFERIVDALDLARSADHSPLFQVLFVLQNQRPFEDLPRVVGDLELVPFDPDLRAARMELSVELTPGAEGLRAVVEFNRDLYDPTTIGRLFKHYRGLIAALLARPGVFLEELSYLSAVERHQLVAEWNDTHTGYLRGEKCLQRLIEAQVERSPDAVAVCFEDQSLSYRQLDRRADRLAHRLQGLGVGAEVLAGVCAERSLELVVALYAVLKAGGAYVPLDPEYPRERLAFMLEDSCVPVLLTQERLAADLPEHRAAVVVLDPPEGGWRNDASEEGENRQGTARRPSGQPGGARVAVGPDNVAYSIYTSGSTGRPKGAMNSHRAIVNRLLWMQDAYQIGPGDRVLQKTPFSFDVSVWEFFWPLATGATLVVARPGGHLDSAYLVRLIAEARITTLHFVPSMLQVFLEEPGIEDLSALRRVICSGEALPYELQERFFSRVAVSSGGTELHNLYGPTEAAVDVTYWSCRRASAERRVPIGWPIANVGIHLLDRNLRPVPTGVPGELHIGGVALARGYRDRPALTAETFIPDPTTGGGRSGPRGSAAAGARLYKTGDLARHLVDGSVEYLGRLDHQVKLRGFRIELGEIEAHLETHPAIARAVVTAQDGLLLAYAGLAAGAAPSAEALHAFLADRLPSSMVPASISVLKELPLTPNGKVDRRALMELADSRPPETGTTSTAPRDPVERILADIWAEVLGVEVPGIEASFFALGGHSLLATRVAARVRRDLRVEISLQRFFQNPRLSALARAVREQQQRAAGAEYPPLRPMERHSRFPLSFAQERLWFIDRLEPGSALYNMPEAVLLRGVLDFEALHATQMELVRRHEVLRTIYSEADGEPRQQVLEVSRACPPRIDLSSLPAERRQREARRLAIREALRPFDLSRDQMLRTSVLCLEPDVNVVLWTMHHIASDGWSMDLLLSEFTTLYRAFAAGRPSPLPELPIQYGDYALWQRGWLQGERLAKEIDYWREHLADADAVLELPLDRPRRSPRSVRGATVDQVLEPDLVASLRSLGKSRGATFFMVLLAAYQALLRRYSGQQRISVGTPIAGRNHVEVEPLIGFFVNTLVLHTRFDGDPSFDDALQRVREVTLDAYAHQSLPFEKLVEELQPARSLTHSPLFQAMFAFIETAAERGKLAGLELKPFADGGDESVARFDLTLAIESEGSDLTGSWEYSTDLFERTTILRMAQHYQVLLASAAADPARPLSQLSWLRCGERHQLLMEYSGAAALPRSASVVEMIAARSQTAPDSIAIVCGNRSHLSFGSLERIASCFGHRLRRAVGNADNRADGQIKTRVGLLMWRSPELLIAMLGAHKARAAYVPLDPTYPRERLLYMVRDAELAAVVTGPGEDELGPLEQDALAIPPVIRLDPSELTDPLAPMAEPRSVDHRSLAYLLYTSGSTGQPKGVMVTHEALANHAATLANELSLGPNDRVLQFASPSFDVAAEEIYPSLSRGSTVILSPHSPIPPDELSHYVERERLTVLNLPASYWHEWVSELWVAGAAPPAGLRWMIVGSEAVTAESWNRWRDLASHQVGLLNAYGLTESTITATLYRSGSEEETGVPIGLPISGLSATVLDAGLAPVPLKTSGELHLGGVGLARGYFHRPAQTAERFHPAVLGDSPGARQYRTGDRVRRLEGGALQFLSRVDDQIKVRGFRIELGEIESVLRAHPDVKDAAIAACKTAGDGQRLVAYVAASGERRPQPSALLSYLKARLPEHMVPSSITLLDRFPHLPNGKVDRKALSALEPSLESPGTRSLSRGRFSQPQTPTEQLVADIWKELLGVERVSRTDDFFALGGHSLLATRVVSRVRHIFGVELELRNLFQYPTVAGFAQAVASRARRDTIAPLTPVEREGAFPLSFAQERLWFIDRLNPGSAQYNMPEALRLRGRLDLPALVASLTEIERRHEVLRTVFVEIGGEPRQRVLPATPAPVPQVDLSDLPQGIRDREARRLALLEAARPFELSRDRMFRVMLVRLDSDEHLALWTMHHIASDGWSMDLFMEELTALYDAFSRGLASPLADLPLQYGDFAIWQRGWLKGKRLERHLEFWRDHLAGVPSFLELPTDRPRPPIKGFRGGTIRLALSPSVTASLETWSRGREVTLFMTLLAGVQGFLSRLSGQPTVPVGTPIAGRTHIELEPLIGFFVNTLVVCGDFRQDPSFTEHVRAIRATTLLAHEHQALPFEKLVEELQPERSQAHTPLFQVMFALQNLPERTAALGGLEVEGVSAEGRTARFDLSLVLEQRDGRIEGELEFDRDLFDATTARRWAEHLAVFLEAAVETPDRRIPELALFGRPHLQQMLVEWNDTGSATRIRCVHHLVAEQAAAVPEAVALVGDDLLLTYGELRRRARRLARHLGDLGVRPETRVAVSMRRSPEMVIGILAVLEAGGAYVPIDPSYPRDRVSFSLRDAGVRLLLTEAALLDSLPALDGDVLCVDDAMRRRYKSLPAAPRHEPPSVVRPENLAYVIYTSGSTGRPKGVLVPHRGVANMVAAQRQRFGLSPSDQILQFSSLSFDASFLDLTMALAHGATLHLSSADRLLPGPALGDLLEERRITITLFTPSTLAVLPHGQFAGLRTLVVGGEACSRELVETWAPGRLMINAYGPTETTVWTASAVCTAGGSTPPPIGRPISATSGYLFDRELRPVPIGTPGQLHLGGIALTRGYGQRPGLTAMAFHPHPLSEVPGERLYRTGDLARHRHDGSLEFLGRIDHQVKLRGFRIELGEIESRLVRHPAVREAIVQLRQVAEDSRLVAYVTPEGDAQLAAGDLREYLGRELPEFMLPSAFVVLEALPLSTSGKLDRRALPAPGRSSGAPTAPENASAATWDVFADRPLEAPRTPVEELLAEIWTELLGVESVSRDDDFFALGGHSLLATRAVSRVREIFGVEMELRALFQHPTVAGFARAVATTTRHEALPPLAPVERPDAFALSFAQERLWFIDQLEPQTALYNIPEAVRLRGVLDFGAFRATLRELERRHEVLRTVYWDVDGEPRQRVLEVSRPCPPRIDLTALAAERREREARRLATREALRPFDLSRDRMLRTSVLCLGTEDTLVLWTLHHIASDGWSMGLLLSEFAALYGAFAAGRPSPLPELQIQYGDYALWQRGWLQGERLAKEIDYWREHLADADTVLELPLDRPRRAPRSVRGTTVDRALGPDLLASLRSLGKRRGVTLFMVLLAAYQALLRRYSGQQGVSVGTPIAGRTHLEVEPLIGFFVNTLVLRTRFDGEPTFGELLQRVRQVTLDAFAHQSLPFEKLVEELQPARSLTHSPLFQVMFAFFEPGFRPAGPTTLEIRPFADDSDVAVAPFDLTLAVAPDDNGLGVTWEYRTDLFDRSTVRRMSEHYRVLLTSAAADLDRPLSQLTWLRPSERHQMLREWNAPAATESPARLHDAFEARAAEAPEATALICGDRRLSYGELEGRSRALANRLIDLGVAAETLVGVYLDRSPELVIALLGVLRAGGAYVPIDPAYPPKRVALLVSDSRVKVMLSRSALAASLPPIAAHLVDLDAPLPAAPRSTLPAPRCRAENLAYVIYTSGSTGRPKGVTIRHRSAAALVQWSRETYDEKDLRSVVAATSVCFDLSVYELFVPLSVAGTVVMVDDVLALPAVREPVTLINTVPSALAELLDAIAWPESLRVANLAGEPLSRNLVDAIYARTRVRRVMNLYGPSEDTTYSTWASIPEGKPTPPAIGRPLSATGAYVMDRCLQPVPPGTVGELCLGGIGLSRGYLRRPGGTAERFVPDDAGGLPGERLYRTGDLTRSSADGELHFLGRIDHQVKVRGYRIELGEVEAALRNHPMVGEVVVLASGRKGGADRLLAFVVAAARAEPEASALRAFVRERLPEHMVPSAFSFLEAFPRLPNGKVDRRALAAAPVSPEPSARRSFAAPQTPAEVLLAEIWSELLGVESVSRDDDFFALGGHSLLATRAVSRVRRLSGIELPLSALFETPTVTTLAQRLEAAWKERGITAARAPLTPSSWEEADEGADDGPVVAIRTDGSGEPMVWMHPVGGEVTGYRALARRLAGERPFLALRRPDHAGACDLDTLVRGYLAALAESGHGHPRILAGWSLGGLLAWRATEILASQGKQTDLLLMVDTADPGDPPPVLAPEEMLAFFARDLMGLGIGGSGHGGTMAALESVLEAWRPDDGLGSLTAAAADLGLLPRGLGAAELERRFLAFRHNYEALRAFRPAARPVAPPPRHAVLVLGSDSPSEHRRRAATSWRRLLGDDLRVVDLPGDHYSLLQEPRVGPLAGVVRAVLRERLPRNEESPSLCSPAEDRRRDSRPAESLQEKTPCMKP